MATASKSVLLSKTFWLNLILGVLPFIIPALQALVVEYPEYAAPVIAVLNVVNRIFGTTGPVTMTAK